MKEFCASATIAVSQGIEVWKKQVDGAWKCVIDIYNDDPSIKSIR
jgi:ketosteroid isomerase-like protein